MLGLDLAPRELAATARLVFGAGPHACPAARLARAVLVDTLAAFAPYRPAVRQARVDRGGALRDWATVEIVSTVEGAACDWR